MLQGKTGVSGTVRQRPADGSLAVTGTGDLHTPFERFANHSLKLVSFHCIKFFVTGGYFNSFGSPVFRESLMVRF